METNDENKGPPTSVDTAVESVTEKPSSDIISIDPSMKLPDPVIQSQVPAAPKLPTPTPHVVIENPSEKKIDPVLHESSSHASSLNESNESTINRKKADDRKKEDEKLAIYKALAIKLKKELVKSREELQKLREDSHEETTSLREQVNSLEATLKLEREQASNDISTLDATVKNLRQKLESSEQDFNALQNDFENYKTRASQIMQQNNPMQFTSNKSFEEERFKQLKILNEEQNKRIVYLESQLSSALERSQEFEKECKTLQEQLEQVQEDVQSIRGLDSKCETLLRENENLKLALKQYRSKLKEPQLVNESAPSCSESSKDTYDSKVVTSNADNSNKSSSVVQTFRQDKPGPSSSLDDRIEEISTRLSPSTSVKEDSQTSSSFDGSTSGYVHIKPNTFEIISRSSILEDAQNQIDNLTKAYLDSENTNSLLSDQVRALKEEIRRMQRGTERMDLAENLEYLKNIVFKFISLDSCQTEQKQQLVPVLSTVLRLSPDETAKLNSIAVAEKTSMASSFFKL